ncbi:hypothetical protein [Caldinitratiruptor microaerophilus]|uniref:HEPN domain-containing protein n=1 Tax=Caldinitratiruptor microaerophilus TaxID=671077 RepID=A0AA35CMJ9_9FIRM|nr:hypothetical protein [Caldinitratiruptor microaerophilus]BDG61952.1 hypothetical protein caldi_30420 [Caldinitratiruptor microaerophilus]
MSSEDRWPRQGDRLFISEGNWWEKATLHWVQGWQALEVYATGYREAAELLSSHVLQTRGDHDLLVYPIVFLWRHYVELRLKGLLRTAKQLSDDESEMHLTHGLKDYWYKLRLLIEQPRFPSIDKSDLDAVESVIYELDSADPSSFAFRYPFDRRGEPSKPNTGVYVDIRNFTDVMGRVSNFLDALNDYLSEYLNIKWELELDMHNDYEDYDI